MSKAPVPIDKQITNETKLYNVDQIVEKLFNDKGLKLSPETIRNYCRTRWVEGVHWKKFANRYLLNLDAIYSEICQ